MFKIFVLLAPYVCLCIFIGDRWPLSYLNLTKNMKTYIMVQRYKECYGGTFLIESYISLHYKVSIASSTVIFVTLLF